MIQKLYIIQIFCIILCSYLANAGNTDDLDEVTWHNQFVADVSILKEGVERLKISVDFLNKRYTNQIDVLKDIDNKFPTDIDSNENVCDKMDAYFNATYKKYNAFETKMLTKLEEVQDEQTTRLDEILVKQNLIKTTCASPDESSISLNVMSAVLADVNEKISNFKEQLKKLELIETQFKVQQTKIEQSNRNQMKILQEINEKLTRNQEKFETFEKELPNLSEFKNKVNQIMQKKHVKLPIEILLGIANANATKLN